MALAPLGPGWAPRIERVLGALGAEAGPDRVAALAAYLDAVATWNARVDLTAARSADEHVDLSLADAAVLAADGGHGPWVDVGSGAGAPGLVLALLRPDLQITLVEPREKRVAFLRTLIGKFRLDRVRLVRGRSDELPDGTFDEAVARATLPPAEWLVEGARLSRGGVWLLVARDPAPPLPGFRVTSDRAYALPLTGAPRRAVRYLRE